ASPSVLIVYIPLAIMPYEGHLMKKQLHKHLSDPDAFFERLLKDPHIRVLYEEEMARTRLAMAVKQVRTRAKLTQAELAHRAGTKQSVIARLEGGKDKRMPTLPLLAHIAAACGRRL